jgi:hypothetical protein
MIELPYESISEFANELGANRRETATSNCSSVIYKTYVNLMETLRFLQEY